MLQPSGPVHTGTFDRPKQQCFSFTLLRPCAEVLLPAQACCNTCAHKRHQPRFAERSAALELHAPADQSSTPSALCACQPACGCTLTLRVRPSLICLHGEAPLSQRPLWPPRQSLSPPLSHVEDIPRHASMRRLYFPISEFTDTPRPLCCLVSSTSPAEESDKLG